MSKCDLVGSTSCGLGDTAARSGKERVVTTATRRTRRVIGPRIRIDAWRVGDRASPLFATGRRCRGGHSRRQDGHRRRRRGSRERRRPVDRGREGDAGGDQLHGDARPRPDLPADDRRAARRARHPADGQREHRALGTAFTVSIDAQGRVTTGISAPTARDGAGARSIPRRGPTISRGPGTCSRCARATAACSCAPARPKRPSIWRASPGCSRPASSARS